MNYINYDRYMLQTTEKKNINKLKIKLLIYDEEITKTHTEIETMNCRGALSATTGNA